MVAITLFFFRRSQNTHTIEDLCFSYFQSLLLLCGTISIGKWRSIGFKNDRFLFILFIIIIIIIIWIIGHSRTVACADTNQPHFLPIYSRHTTRRTIYYNRWLMSIVVCEHLGTYQKNNELWGWPTKILSTLFMLFELFAPNSNTLFTLSISPSLTHSFIHSISMSDDTMGKQYLLEYPLSIILSYLEQSFICL